MRSGTLYFVLILLVLGIFAVSPVLSDPTDAAGWYAAGQNLTNAGNYSAGLYAYKQAIALDPNSSEAWNGLADVLNRAHPYTQDPLATLNMALEASNQSLALNASSAAAWINRGQILYNFGSYYQQLNDKATADGYYNEQLDAFDHAISIEPDNAEAWFNKGYALCGIGKCTEGIVAFQKVEQLDPGYPYLELNIAQAEKQAAAETPFYITYDIEIVMAAIAGIVAAVWFIAVRKKY